MSTEEIMEVVEAGDQCNSNKSTKCIKAYSDSNSISTLPKIQLLQKVGAYFQKLYILNYVQLALAHSYFWFGAAYMQVLAEVIGTYFVIFAGCGSVAVNKIYGSVTFPGICVVWGLIVMVMIYSVGHISGAHFNPAVTIAFAVFRHFPHRQASFP